MATAQAHQYGPASSWPTLSPLLAVRTADPSSRRREHAMREHVKRRATIHRAFGRFQLIHVTLPSTCPFG